VEANGAGDAVGGGEVVGSEYSFELSIRWAMLDLDCMVYQVKQLFLALFHKIIYRNYLQNMLI